jgi:tRNA(fMet)-specific endonuclease VapC
MSKGYLLDTNIAIAILAGELAVIDFIREAAIDKLPFYFSVITECEVLSGLPTNQSSDQIKLFNIRRCLDVTSSIAQRAGTIRREQRSKSRKLKTPDALIIATAATHQLTLVSRDHDMNFVTSEYGIPFIQP